MGSMPRQPGDAVLCRDGTVKVKGAKVGFWWIDGNDLYHFGFTRPDREETGQGVVVGLFRHELKALIPEYVAC